MTVPCSPAANFGDRAKCDELLFTFKITPVGLVSHICGILIIVTSGMCPINNEKHISIDGLGDNSSKKGNTSELISYQ